MIIEKDGFIFEEYNGFLKLVGLKGRLLENIVIPNKVDGKLVTIIAPYAFRGLIKLKTVCIPDCVNTIGQRAFSGCQNLNRATIYRTDCPARLVEINPMAFNHCVQLEYFSSTVPLFLYMYAFLNCKRLSNLNATVVYCGDNAFQNCSSLQQIAFDDNIIWSKKAFNKCDKLQIMIFNGPLGKSLLDDMPALESVKEKSWICKSNFSHLDLALLGFKIKII